MYQVITLSKIIHYEPKEAETLRSKASPLAAFNPGLKQPITFQKPLSTIIIDYLRLHIS